MEDFSQVEGEYQLESVLEQVERLDSINPKWREEFDPEFLAAIKRVLVTYTAIKRLNVDTARRAREVGDALAYLEISIYTSIERVIKRKRIDKQGS